MTLAPIALFVYNRPWHTQQIIEALQKNKLAAESELFIFSDAPKNNEAQMGVKEVREYIKTVKGFNQVAIIERTENLGLAKSIITGVSEIVNKFGKIIALEDDLITSPYFLKYMNESLEFYQNEERVISITGYIYPIRAKLPEIFFIKGADCWGWATWKRGWDLFKEDGLKLLTEIKERKLEKAFNFNGSYNYTQMLKDQIAGKNDSWAVRWYASAFLENKLTLYPCRSLVYNIGNDSSGIHCGETDIFNTEVASSPVMIKRIPIEENRCALQEIEKFFRYLKPSFFSRIKNKIEQFI